MIFNHKSTALSQFEDRGKEAAVKLAQLHLTQLGIYITIGTKSRQAASRDKVAASQEHYLEVSADHRGAACIQSWAMQIVS